MVSRCNKLYSTICVKSKYDCQTLCDEVQSYHQIQSGRMLQDRKELRIYLFLALVLKENKNRDHSKLTYYRTSIRNVNIN